MAIYHRPSGDQSYFDLIRSFRPQGSTTVVWAQDMATGQLVRMLRWGTEIYLPVYEGMQLGIGLRNGSGQYRAYPIYVEARNLWEGGPAQPGDCSTDHMWELQPWQSMVVDKLMNPDRPAGRPLIIQSVGQGMTIGEATFGTTEFRGQIRIYERLPYGGGLQATRPTNVGRGAPDTFRGIPKGVTLGGEESYRGASESFDLGPTKGPAGIGAGAEEYQAHHDTGVSYQHNTQPVIFLRVEYREDLHPMLNAVWRDPWSWHEPVPFGDWWDEPWSWRPLRPTAPEIPVARPKPHRPY